MEKFLITSMILEKDGIADKDLICHGRILSASSYGVYHIFCHTKTACDLCTGSDQRYATAEKSLLRDSINN